jgi:hypothetical protein
VTDKDIRIKCLACAAGGVLVGIGLSEMVRNTYTLIHPPEPVKLWVSYWHNHIIVKRLVTGHLPTIKEWDVPPESGVGTEVVIP